MKTIHAFTYTFILCLLSFALRGQDYYYNGSEKVAVIPSDKSFISFGPVSPDIAEGFETVEKHPVENIVFLKNRKASFSIKRLEKLDQIVPAFMFKDGGEAAMFPIKTVSVKLKQHTDSSRFYSLLRKGEVATIKEKYGIIELEINDIRNTLKIANRIYESGIAEFSIPDFYLPIKPNVDPLFRRQFQMHNTGQSIYGTRGKNDIDCNALEAWDISLGDNVTVAVLDDGLEAHEDLGNRIIGSYDPVTGGAGIPRRNNEVHGLNCAGIIGATHNDKGIRGVAPHVNFLSVKVLSTSSSQYASPQQVAAGIRWAVNHGADILSCSWSYPYYRCGQTNMHIEEAIRYAVTEGRGKKGAVVVFGSGNGGGCVEYPATNSNVIAVGAIDHKGTVFSYSGKGSQLDLVAPSGELNYLGNVVTLDRMGPAGLVPGANGHYEPFFGGTSAACPVVSGVAALVLSINPNLTYRQVQRILTSTATDMGSRGFDHSYGFGRVNALAAVQEAYRFVYLIGNTTVCNSNTSYSLSQTPPDRVSVTWETSSNLQIVSSSRLRVTVRALNSSVQGNGFVRARVAASPITKKVWVGRPRPVRFSSIASFGCTRGEINVSGGINNTYEYEWTVSGGTIVYPPVNTYRYKGKSTVIFVDPADSPYGFTVSVSAHNKCGNSDWDKQHIPTPHCKPDSYGSVPATPLSYSPDLDDNVVLFPNPASHMLVVNLNSLKEDGKELNVRIKLFELNGHKVFETQTHRAIERIPTGLLKNGSYVLHLFNGKKTLTERFTVKH